MISLELLQLRRSNFNKICLTGTLSIFCRHQTISAKDRLITGVLIGGKCYSNSITVPAQGASSPHATTMNSIEFAKQHNPSFAKACLTKTVSKIQSVLKSNSRLFSENVAELKTADIASATKPPDSLPERLRGVLQTSSFLINSKLAEKLSLNSRKVSFGLNSTPTLDVVKALEHLDPVQIASNPDFAIKARTEKLLWHQRLGHPNDWYLYDAHKSMTGVPKFTRESNVTSLCPTYILAKQTKASPGHHSI